MIWLFWYASIKIGECEWVSFSIKKDSQQHRLNQGSEPDITLQNGAISSTCHMISAMFHCYGSKFTSSLDCLNLYFEHLYPSEYKELL